MFILFEIFDTRSVFLKTICEPSGYKCGSIDKLSLNSFYYVVFGPKYRD